VIHIARYLGVDERPDAGAIEAELEQLADAVQPGWREVVHSRRFLPSLMVQGDMARAEAGGKRGRVAEDATGVAGLYLAGDWVGDTGMLADTSAASGLRVAQLCRDRLSRADERAA